MNRPAGTLVIAFLRGGFPKCAHKGLPDSCNVLLKRTFGACGQEGQEHVNYLLGRVAGMIAEAAAQNSSAPAQPPAQPPAGEPAPTPIPTPKMLNPPPYILPGAASNQAVPHKAPPSLAAPNQAMPFQAPPQQAVPNQAAFIQAVPNQAGAASAAAAQMAPKLVVAREQAAGIPNAPAGLGAGLARPPPASTIQVGSPCAMRHSFPLGNISPDRSK